MVRGTRNKFISVRMQRNRAAGGMIPFIFSSLAIRAMGEVAMAMVEEVRRQFRTIPGIMEGTGKPEYDKFVAISTETSLKMMLPGAIGR